MLIKLIKRNLQLNQIISKQPWVNPEDAFQYYHRDFKGVYLWQRRVVFPYSHWRTVYVGQSIHVLKRLNQHLSGNGNSYIYRDVYKNRKLRWKAIPLDATKFKTLDHLEKNLIHHFHTTGIWGYNRNDGNGNRTF